MGFPPATLPNTAPMRGSMILFPVKTFVKKFFGMRLWTKPTKSMTPSRMGILLLRLFKSRLKAFLNFSGCTGFLHNQALHKIDVFSNLVLKLVAFDFVRFGVMDAGQDPLSILPFLSVYQHVDCAGKCAVAESYKPIFWSGGK